MLNENIGINFLLSIKDRALKNFRNFSILDIGVFKVCLVLIGAGIGVAFKNFFKKYRAFFFIAFAISYIYLMYKTFADNK